MNNKRARGRGGPPNGKKHMSPRPHPTYDSAGPEVRIRGNAHQVLEKYLGLARDAQASGDRIAAENYYQHAEHYYRMINSFNQANGHQNRRPMGTPADNQPFPQEEGENAQQAVQDSAPDEAAQHPAQQDEAEVISTRPEPNEPVSA
jgi:hypothetical protein